VPWFDSGRGHRATSASEAASRPFQSQAKTADLAFVYQLQELTVLGDVGLCPIEQIAVCVPCRAGSSTPETTRRRV